MVFANGKKKLLPLIPLIAALAACGGGGGGGGSTTTTTTTGTGTGLQMPVAMSALAAPTTTTAAPPIRGLKTDFYGASKAVTNVTFPTTSNYATDESHTYEWDASMQSLQTVNMILCLMDQTKASAMVNKGAYIALVNEDKCEQGQNGSSAGSSSGQSSGQVVSLNKWTIESTRADNSSYQYVKIWVPGRGGADPKDNQTVLVYVTIRDGVSTTKPYGDFDLDFNGVATIGGTSVTVMKGKLKTVPNTTSPQFQFFNVEGDYVPGVTGLGFGYQQDANVILSGTASAPSSNATTHVKMTEGTSSNEATFKIAADPNLVLREKIVANVPTQACLSRANFNKQVWRYNLYHEAAGTFNTQTVTAGQRVTLNSGFPFKTTISGVEKFGYVGYWGIWMEGNTTPADSATITKVDYSNNTAGASYTVRIAPGKMVKRTANTENLSNLRGVELYYWGPDPSGGASYGQYLVTVDTNDKFIATDSVTWGNGGRLLTPLLSGGAGYQAAPVAGYNITPTAPGQNLWLWSDALGGNVTYVQGATPATTVTFYAQEFVLPSGIADGATLYCYDRCLKGGLTDLDVPNNLYYSSGTEHAYTVSVSSGKVTLMDGANPVSLAGLSPTGLTALANAGNDWGISTGEMVTAQINPANWWQVYSAPVSYRWETGTKQWNQMVTVTDNNNNNAVASFDKPLQFTYTLDSGDDANLPTTSPYIGKKFQLQYGGPGELWGFPWMEDTANPGHWRSSVTLKDGVMLTDSANKTFVIKAIEQEKTMTYATTANDVTSCTNTPASLTTVTAPLLVLTSDNLVTVSFGVNDKPAVTTAPAVIEGVLQ